MISESRGEFDMTKDINVLRQMLEEKNHELEEYVLNHDSLGEEAESMRRELSEIQDKIKEIEQERLDDNKEITVNDYIRMDNGDIDKVTDILELNCYKCKNKVRAGEYIAKHSKKLEGLIEKSDILQIRLIRDGVIAYYGIDSDGEFKVLIEDLQEGLEKNEIEILGVLSKNQFMQNCFVVNDKC